MAWYRASDLARRGFCCNCGASLFWKPDREYRISFSPAALHGASGLRTTHHWHREDAGDYYAPEGPPPPPTQAPDRLNCSCLCGSVAFSVPGPAGDVTACHCDTCRILSGHHAAWFDIAEAALAYTARASLAQYAPPTGGRRGFCRDCGSSLWLRNARGTFSVAAGSVVGASGGTLTRHIHVAGRGDWYAIDDALPQLQSGG